MSSKVAVVTGSNKGIGFGIAKGLCEKYNGTVYVTARDVNRGEEAVNKLKSLGHNPAFHQLDISSQTSISQFASYLKQKYGGIDLLVNNAAIAYPNSSNVPFGEQAENTVGVNYFDTLMVCDTLFPLLKKNARVVHVSSSAGHLSRIPSDIFRKTFGDSHLTVPQLSDLMKQFVSDAKQGKNEENGWGNSAYVVSKVGVTALTIIQQREFDANKPELNISVNAVHPGYVDTDMTSHKGTLTVDEGARAPLFLSLDNHNLKGEYVWCDCKVIDWLADSVVEKKL